MKNQLNNLCLEQAFRPFSSVDKRPWRHGEDHFCLAEGGGQDCQNPVVLLILFPDEATGWPGFPRASPRALVANEVATIHSRLTLPHPTYLRQTHGRNKVDCPGY